MYHPFSRREDTFPNVYPQVSDIYIEYTETDSRYEDNYDEGNPKIISGINDIDFNIPCCCSNCHNGGLNIEWVIRSMVGDKEVERHGEGGCGGYTNKKTKEPCLNHFYYKIKIKYK